MKRIPESVIAGALDYPPCPEPGCGAEKGEPCRVVNKSARDWPQVAYYATLPRRVRPAHARRVSLSVRGEGAP